MRKQAETSKTESFQKKEERKQDQKEEAML